MNRKQREIIAEVARKHGIKKEEAYEIWKGQFKFIHEKTKEIIQPNEDGTYNEEDFKVFMLPYWGKFVPRLGTIRTINKLKKKSYEDKNSKSSEVVAVQQKGPKSGN